MNASLVTRSAGIVAVAALGLAACGSNNSSGTSTSAGGSSACGAASLTAQGSTFQQTLESQWASKFPSMCSGAQVTYSGTGSAAGIAQFTAGKVDFAGSDVTMTPQEQSQATSACGSTALTLPITSGGVAIIYNLKGVTNLKLSATTLADIFTGKVTKWNDPVIAKANPGVTLPSTAITTVHRADGSGTTSVFTSFMNSLAPAVWTSTPDKVWPTTLHGQAATGSSGVTQSVSQTNGGITYAEISYAKQAQLPTAEVQNAKGSYVAISSSTVASSINSGFSVTGTGNNLAGALSFAKMTGYPISTVSYVLTCSKYKDAKVGKLVGKYLSYAAGSGQSEADALGFAPLPSALDSKVTSAISTIS